MTDPDTGVHRLRAAFATTSPADVATGDCPRPESIWDAARNELPRAESRSILQHVASCPVCTEAWRLARALDEGESLPTEAGADESPGWRGRPYGRFAAAAAVAATLAYFGLGLAVHERQIGGSIARSSSEANLELVSAGTLGRSDCSPVWTGLEGALYDVEVSDANLELVAAASGLSSPTLRVPAADLPSDGALLVYILAYREADGTPLAERTLELDCSA